MSNKSSGLRGQVAGRTSICTVGQSGDGLHYRGYSVEELAQKCSFEEVAYLLIKGELPNQSQLEAFNAQIIDYRGPKPTGGV